MAQFCKPQFSPAAQLCLTLCNPMDCSTSGFPVHHQLPELMQTHVHWVHIRLPCPSPTPRAYADSCPLSQWCHPTISSSVAPFFCLQSSSIRVFSNELVPRIRWPRYWSFSTNPFNEYSGLISSRMDWLDLLAVQGTLQESSPTPQFKSINSSALSLLHSPTLTSIHDHGKNHSLD